MTFIHDICTQEVFTKLALPVELSENKKMNPIGHKLIFDISTQSALLPHPFHYSDYPDRNLSLYVAGKHFNCWELVERSDGPDRVEIFISGNADESECQLVGRLMEEATAVLRSESKCSVPILIRRA
jgi:hypothetical protein